MKGCAKSQKEGMKLTKASGVEEKTDKQCEREMLTAVELRSL